MSAAGITIAWTAGEAVLLGPESRFVRQPLTGEEDAPALILEIWRTEFPEIAAATLLSGDDPAVAAGIPRLIEIAREAGLRLELGAPAARIAPRRRRFSIPRVPINPRAAFLGAIVAAAILIAGWRWSQAREQARLGRLTAAERASELRQAQNAAAGRRSQAMVEQTEALLAAVKVPRQFHRELLAALEANVPPSIVIDSLEVLGSHCKLEGHTVTGAPGAEAAPEILRHALFNPAPAWEVETPVSVGSAFTWAATAVSPKKDLAAPLPSPEEATTARDRLPTSADVQFLLRELAPNWRIESRGATITQGIEHSCYRLSVILKPGDAWPKVMALTRRLSSIEGISIESISLTGTQGPDGQLKDALLTAVVRQRVSDSKSP